VSSFQPFSWITNYWWFKYILNIFKKSQDSFKMGFIFSHLLPRPENKPMCSVCSLIKIRIKSDSQSFPFELIISIPASLIQWQITDFCNVCCCLFSLNVGLWMSCVLLPLLTKHQERSFSISWLSSYRAWDQQTRYSKKNLDTITLGKCIELFIHERREVLFSSFKWREFHF